MVKHTDTIPFRRHNSYHSCWLFLVAVLHKVITGQAGDTTVFTVDGNVEFKETIKVTKKSATTHEKIENYSVDVGIHTTQIMKSKGFMGVNIWIGFCCYYSVLSGWL